ncbi:Adenylate cyclase type 2, partial [Orchesella cincta]
CGLDDVAGVNCAGRIGILLVVFLVGQFPIFQKHTFSFGLSFFVILTLSATIFLSAHVSSPCRPADALIPVFILIFAINTMMPLPRFAALVVSLVLIIVHLLLALLLSDEFTESLGRQAVASGVFLLAGLIAGVYHQQMALIAHKRTCDSTKTCLESRVKLNV